ncbi:MAG: hypothetical protein LBQ61_04605 [Spirochaetales bacterium]|jgi:hypothetical protein|nr:hypothetical protein [Spirochaetales bacterium]
MKRAYLAGFGRLLGNSQFRNNPFFIRKLAQNTRFKSGGRASRDPLRETGEILLPCSSSSCVAFIDESIYIYVSIS